MRAALVLVALALAGCSATAPAQREDRAAPVVLPAGYHDPGMAAAPVPECETAEGKARNDPRRTLNPAALRRDAEGRFTGPELARIRREGLVVGVSPTAPLFSKRDPVTGRMAGLEIDIVNRIAAELFGRPLAPDDPRLRLVAMPTGSRLLALATPKNAALRRGDPKLAEVPMVDMVVANVTFTCDRVVNHGVVYSTPYVRTTAGILHRTGGERATELADLSGRKVCAGSATTSIADLLAARSSTGLLPVSVPDSSDCLMLLQRGLVDAIYTDTQVLQGLSLQDPGTTLVDLGTGGGLAGVVMSGEHPDLIRFVNAVLAEMRADGTLTASATRWFVHEVRAAGMPDLGPLPTLPPITYVD
ncbi:transporter substrate-binding domain-containing protein [Actinokineospora sp. NPDC004072]